MNSQMIFFLLFIAVFYIFIFLPQIRKSKKQKQFRAEIAKGDKIVTTGGIHGKIAELKDLTAVIEVGDGVKLTIDRSAISMEASALVNSGTTT
jgi:preprotein translocase subunit YajC